MVLNVCNVNAQQNDKKNQNENPKMNLFKTLFSSKPAKKQPELDIQFIDLLMLGKPLEALKILDKGANPNAFHFEHLPAIYIAANKGYEDVVRQLIEKGAIIDAKGSNKKESLEQVSALLTSSAKGNLTITDLLVSNGANIEIQDKSGITPLMTACYRGHAHIVAYLIKRGASLEKKDSYGYTALMYATNSGNIKCVETLVKNSADIEAKDNDDSTPIMFAAQHGYSEIVKLLLEKGANKSYKGKHGLNAIDFAKQNNHQETIDVLEGKFTKNNIQDNPYSDLRNQSINVTPEQLELDSENGVYGVVMDWDMGNAIVTVVSFITGDASVYISTGQAFIGGFAHESVLNAAKQFVKMGENYLPKSKKVDNYDPNEEYKVNFYLLTKSGKHYIEDEFANIENETSILLDLFEAGNKVITEYRLIESENK